ncbi:MULTISPECIES: DUF3515 domain-containing protein [unclassified Blastococcus]
MDPLRRAAILITAITLPVVIALVVLVNVRGEEPASAPEGPAEIEGAAPVRPEDLPVLEVDTPEITPEAEAHCPALMENLPLELAGEPSRRVRSESPFVYAWGEPAAVLTCGVQRPEGWTVGASAIQINGVQWHVDTSDPDATVWTAVDRPVYVEMRLPAGVDSAPVTALTVPLAEALPYQEPTPGP